MNAPNPYPNQQLGQQLGQGRYRVQLNEAGAGASLWDWMALSRWSGDGVLDAQGFFVYLRDVEDGRLWSATLQPIAGAPAHYAAQLHADGALFERSEHGIDSRLAVSVNGTSERRRLLLRNPGARTRRIELTSYVEVALSHPAADQGHPAFSRLFVQTRLSGTDNALVAQRRPRSRDERWPALLHRLEGARVEAFETDRLRFVGRGRDPQCPALAMAGTAGKVLDPILSLRCTLEVPPGADREVAFTLELVEDPAALAPPAHDAPWPDDLPAAPIETAFEAHGSVYRIRMPWTADGPALPPLPWTNVVANERFGFIASETGAGMCWSRNSQANRLTPWFNDAVSDPPGEAWYLRDEDDGACWSPVAAPMPAAVAHEARHGFGYSRFNAESHGIVQELRLFVPRADPVRIASLSLRNTEARPRRLSVYVYQDLVLGTLPDRSAGLDIERRGGLLVARNPRATDFDDGRVFSMLVGMDGGDQETLCVRAAFIGPHGSLRAPAALRMPRLPAPGEQQAPDCFARRVLVDLPALGSLSLHLILGEALGEQQLQELSTRYTRPKYIEQAFAEVCAFWHDTLDGLRVQTPEPGLDRLANGWLAYQTLACRIWARSAFYQAGGAWGFRDQLQDAGNLCLLAPQRTRAQILLHAAHQYQEGDVQHWWHEAPIARGLRTRFSDDLLWLPYVTAQYLAATGDTALLDEQAPFLSGPQLAPGEDERYVQPADSGERANVYTHCVRAIERSLDVGAHGLPLMGTGDWNDGMNRVGREGRGESVWMGFFLASILESFAALAEQRGEAERARRYRAHRLALALALNAAGWDGAWYRRAYYDDGTALGTQAADECRVDGLVQAWSILSGIAPQERAEQALDAVERELVDAEHGLIRLLTPPFVDTPQDPGYIKGYVAGVRENGGQYTHAACWMIAAFARAGRRDTAMRLLLRLTPSWHARDPAALARYKVEPYVIAADIYGAAPHEGRGGWTWYTGAAGWTLRLIVENLLGLRMEQGRFLVLEPRVPDTWPGYRIDWSLPGSTRGTRYAIEVANPHGCAEAVRAIVEDGQHKAVDDGLMRLELVDDGRVHALRVELGAREPCAQGTCFRS